MEMQPAAHRFGAPDAHSEATMRTTTLFNRPPPRAGVFSDPDFRTPRAKRPARQPADGDLSRMTDDGCPLFPDPARWTDPRWQDKAVA